MPPRTWVNLRDWTGTLVTVFDAFDTDGLMYKRTLDNLGTCELTISLDDPRCLDFKRDYFIEIVRQDTDNGIAAYTEEVFLHRDRSKSIDDQGNRKFKSSGVTLEHLLKRKIIAYYAGSSLASQNTFADDAMKLFVTENAGVLATAPPRILDGSLPNFDVDTLLGLGPIWQGNRQFTNLFDTVREIALASLVDFKVVVEQWNPLTIRFHTYFPYLGSDRSIGNTTGTTPVFFSPKTGNMLRPTFTETTKDEITEVIVLGQGQQSNRQVIVAYDTDTTGPGNGHLNASPWNAIERSVSQPQDGITQGLLSVGYAELQHADAKITMAFDVPYGSKTGTVYGKDWFFGDNVSYSLDDSDGVLNKRVTSINVKIQNGNESLSATLAEIT